MFASQVTRASSATQAYQYPVCAAQVQLIKTPSVSAHRSHGPSLGVVGVAPARRGLVAWQGVAPQVFATKTIEPVSPAPAKSVFALVSEFEQKAQATPRSAPKEQLPRAAVPQLIQAFEKKAPAKESSTATPSKRSNEVASRKVALSKAAPTKVAPSKVVSSKVVPTAPTKPKPSKLVRTEPARAAPPQKPRMLRSSAKAPRRVQASGFKPVNFASVQSGSAKPAFQTKAAVVHVDETATGGLFDDVRANLTSTKGPMMEAPCEVDHLLAEITAEMQAAERACRPKELAAELEQLESECYALTRKIDYMIEQQKVEDAIAEAEAEVEAERLMQRVFSEEELARPAEFIKQFDQRMEQVLAEAEMEAEMAALEAEYEAEMVAEAEAELAALEAEYEVESAESNTTMEDVEAAFDHAMRQFVHQGPKPSKRANAPRKALSQLLVPLGAQFSHEAACAWLGGEDVTDFGSGLVATLDACLAELHPAPKESNVSAALCHETQKVISEIDHVLDLLGRDVSPMAVSDDASPLELLREIDAVLELLEDRPVPALSPSLLSQLKDMEQIVNGLGVEAVEEREEQTKPVSALETARTLQEELTECHGLLAEIDLLLASMQA